MKVNLKVFQDKKEALKAFSGSSLLDRISGITYDDLVDMFGEPLFLPEDSKDGKVNFEWVVEFNNEVFTIYDWKESEEYAKNSLGRKNRRAFHIGGKEINNQFIDFLYFSNSNGLVFAGENELTVEGYDNEITF